MMKSMNGMPEVNLFSRLDKLVFTIMGVVVLAAISWKIIDSNGSEKSKKPQSKNSTVQQTDTSGKEKKTNTSSQITIVQKWDMPQELKEISALSYVDANRFACVQDEHGIVYVYNTADKKIEKKIPFTEKGDFEGVAFTGENFYVVRADGVLFETPTDETGKNKIQQYKTSLTVKHNIEGLCYDKPNNRLLLAAKDEDPNHPGFKSIYAFDLDKKKLLEEPVFRIDLNHKLFTQSAKKKIAPSAITLHPETQEIFITDGPQSHLLILDKSGNPSQILALGKDFSQPEGITFDAEGNLFISNEGTKQPGNILQVKIP